MSASLLRPSGPSSLSSPRFWRGLRSLRFALRAKALHASSAHKGPPSQAGDLHPPHDPAKGRIAPPSTLRGALRADEFAASRTLGARRLAVRGKPLTSPKCRYLHTAPSLRSRLRYHAADCSLKCRITILHTALGSRPGSLSVGPRALVAGQRPAPHVAIKDGSPRL